MSGEAYIPPQRIGIDPITADERAMAIELCALAMEAFRLNGYKPVTLVKHSNITVRLAAAGLPDLALRIRSAPGVDSATEFAWLAAIRERTDVQVVEPYSGTYADSVRMFRDVSGKAVECVLYRWVEGRPLAMDLQPPNYFELGRTTAVLHEFAGRWTPPSGLTPLVWDRTMYYPGSRLVFSDYQYRGLLSAGQVQRISDLVTEADEELRQLAHGTDARFLHGNIEMWNVIVAPSGQLTLIDFEDVMYGSPVLDVAITLFYGQERDDFGLLRAAYEDGYRSVREWPVRGETQLQLLHAARATMLLNYAFQSHKHPASVRDRLLPIILRPRG